VEIDKRRFPMLIMMVFVLAILAGVVFGFAPSHGDKAEKQQGRVNAVIVVAHDGDDLTANINI